MDGSTDTAPVRIFLLIPSGVFCATACFIASISRLSNVVVIFSPLRLISSSL